MTKESPCPRPALRYCGGKFRIAAEFVELMPGHNVYVEPFGGAASVLLAKPVVPCEIYNDRCDDVVNFFRQLRDAPEALIRGAFLTPYSRTEYRQAYEYTSDPLEAARRFLYRSMAGMGSDASRRVSSFRTSLDDGLYAHARSWEGMPKALGYIADRLRSGVIIENKDALEVMEQFDGERTLHYVDPPYPHSTRKSKARAYTHEFATEKDHARLLAFLRTLKGKVIVSSYENELYDAALKGWERRPLTQRDQRNAKRAEMVWMNFEPEELLL